MIQTINHPLREELGITPMAYLVIDCYWQLRTEDDVPRALVERETGLSSGQISLALKELGGCGLYSEEERTFGAGWKAAHSPNASKDLAGLTEIAAELIAFFNEKTGRYYEVTPKFITNLRNIKRILPVKDTGMPQFKGVIEWAVLTWKKEFEDKVRPQTLFQSVDKFSDYLAKARTYWREQNKKANG